MYNELYYCWLTRTKNKLVCSPRDQDELLLRHFRVFLMQAEQVNKLLQQHLSHFEGFARGQCRKPQPECLDMGVGVGVGAAHSGREK